MRIPLLIVLVILLPQTSVFAQTVSTSENETDCRLTVERSSKNQTERLMNQYYLGQIGGLEFEQMRSAIISQAAVEREVCEQKIFAVLPQREYPDNHQVIGGREPASVGIDQEGAVEDTEFEETDFEQ
jgi:hypothetical protein